MKKILVPCDFSSPSKEAFQFAVQLAERNHGEVYVLKVTELPVLYEPGFGIPEYGFDRGLMDELAEDARHKLEDFQKSCGATGSNVHLLSENGPVISTIRNVSDDQEMDLVVMGTHSPDTWIESVLGTNTRKIIRSSSVPVLALKKSVPLDSIRNIVFPTMLSTERDDVVQRVISLQKFFNATLHILFVNSPEDFHRDKDIRKHMDAFLEKYKFEQFTRNVYNDDSSAQGIIDFTEEINGDLIAMATHARRGLAPLFNDSVTADVLEGTKALLWSYVAE